MKTIDTQLLPKSHTHLNMLSGVGKKILTMERLTIWKIISGLLAVCLIITTIVYFQKSDESHDNAPNPSLIGLDWYCETDIGTPCLHPSTLSGVGRKDYYYKGRTSWTCTDKNKQVLGNYDVSRMVLTNDSVSAKSKCMDINYRPQIPATPCILDFKICMEDPRVSAITLKCKYLKDFKQTGNQGSSRASQNATCETNGEIYTYYMNTGYSTIKIDFNNDMLHWEKPILPDSN